MQQREEPIKKPIFLCHISKLTGFYQKKKTKKKQQLNELFSLC